MNSKEVTSMTIDTSSLDTAGLMNAGCACWLLESPLLLPLPLPLTERQSKSVCSNIVGGGFGGEGAWNIKIAI